MTVRGEERAFLERYRRLNGDQRYALLTYLDALETRGASLEAEARFRGGARKKR